DFVDSLELCQKAWLFFMTVGGDLMSQKDNINHPEHIEGYMIGNVIEYITRYEEKGGLEDLKKAHWYLEVLIKHNEEKNGGNQDVLDIVGRCRELGITAADVYNFAREVRKYADNR
ncbi:DUF3310 domain-containing protein, partial [Paenibacillus larvae]